MRARSAPAQPPSSRRTRVLGRPHRAVPRPVRAPRAINRHQRDVPAAALTWLGERLYYLAAIGVPPFTDEKKLVDVLTHIWLTSLYCPQPPKA